MLITKKKSQPKSGRYTQFGEFSRNEEKLKDVYVIAKEIPEGTILTTTSELWSDWGLVAYMSRIGYLSLDCNNEHEYYLAKKNTKIKQNILNKYDIADMGLTKYVILKKKHKN